MTSSSGMRPRWTGTVEVTRDLRAGNGHTASLIASAEIRGHESGTANHEPRITNDDARGSHQTPARIPRKARAEPWQSPRKALAVLPVRVGIARLAGSGNVFLRILSNHRQELHSPRMRFRQPHSCWLD